LDDVKGKIFSEEVDVRSGRISEASDMKSKFVKQEESL
jgi:hypothetical protein